jgi:hypothetical protein
MMRFMGVDERYDRTVLRANLLPAARGHDSTSRRAGFARQMAAAFLTLMRAGPRLSRSFGARARILSRAVKREAGRVSFAESNERQPALPPQR